MKVERQSVEKFVPIVITLESQDEVDQLFAVVNYIPIQDTIILTKQIYDELRKYKHSGYNNHFNKLSNRL